MATKKKRSAKPKAIVNRRASFDYVLGDELVVGLVLSGQEVKAAREGKVNLKGAFVTIRNNELWLNNASFSLVLTEKGKQQKTVETKPRKLLAKHREIGALMRQKQAGYTIIPTKLLIEGKFIKLVIAIGRGKKRYDKRQALKRRDQERESMAIIKGAKR